MTISNWKDALRAIKVPEQRAAAGQADEFLTLDDIVTVKKDSLRRQVHRVLSEIEDLAREDRWDDILALAYPVEEKFPKLCDKDLDLELRAKVSFALGQKSRFDDAIAQLKVCVKRDASNFHYHSALAYNAYNSLYAAMNKEIFLRGKLRAGRIDLAHRHLRRAQELRPDGVTNFYRQGMLYKKIEPNLIDFRRQKNHPNKVSGYETSRHLSYFDTLNKDGGYAGSIETDPEHMLFSHGVKRFFGAMLVPWGFGFGKVLRERFLWRLRIANPLMIIIGLDTMVMENDEARKRHGLRPTYKKEKGFQPIQMTWGRFIIDAIFRSGDKHSNHGDDAAKMVKAIVSLIRKRYREDVPIVIRLDSGFFDQKLFEVFESLGISYICGGKLYDDIGDDIGAMVSNCDRSVWGRYENGNQVWDYVELGDRRGRWMKWQNLIPFSYK